MGSTGRRFSVRAGEPTWIQDWVDAELVERVEVVEARVASLDLERDRLEAELAQRVEAIEVRVALLDAERTELETSFAERIELIESLVESLEIEHDWLETELTIPLPQPERENQGERAEETLLVRAEAAPAKCLTPALLALFVLGPWALIAAVVYAVWTLI